MQRSSEKTILTSCDLGTNFGQKIVKISSVVGAYREVLASPPDLIILECELRDGDAFDILTYLRNAKQCVPAILLAGRPPKQSSLADRISFVHHEIKRFELENLVDQKLSSPNTALYSVEEYLNLATKSQLSIEISVCRGDQEECNRIVLKNGVVIDSQIGALKGKDALKQILALQKVDIRFRKPEHEEEKKDEEWHKMFFSVGDEPLSFPTPLNGPSEAENSMMKQNAASPRTTVGHGTGGVPFLVEREILTMSERFSRQETVDVPPIHALIEATEVSDASISQLNSPVIKQKPIIIEDEPIVERPTPKISAPEPPPEIQVVQKRTVKPEIVEEVLVNVKGLDIRELLEMAMEEMISRRYDHAYFVLQAVLKIDSTHTTALANLTRLEELLKDKI